MVGSNKSPYPKCECGHSSSKHWASIIDQFNVTRERSRCKVKNCACMYYKLKNAWKIMN